MKRTLIKRLLLTALMLPLGALSQIFEIEQTEKSFFISDEPTITFLYPAQNPKSILIFIPGGEGSVGVKKDWNANSRYFSTYHFNRMLASLANPVITDGTTSVVIFDSPKSLGYGNYLALRGAKDHMVRIESTIKFYKDKYDLPVWLLGHSAGGVSLGEFTNYLIKNNKRDLLSGMIFSAGRRDSKFDNFYDFPTLFLIHQDDVCFNTLPNQNKEIYEKFATKNKSATEFRLINGGTSQGDPCTSGHHMYFGSETQAARSISQFISTHNPVNK
jgi:hypothetical protein